jgi:hypothetical protein
MQSSIKTSHLNITILALVVSGLLARTGRYLFTHYFLEDAFITFRFASQVAAGSGFVHNTGEKIYGSTTPLFTLLLAGWHYFTHGNIPEGAIILGLTASVGTLVCVWMALRRLGSTPAQQGFVIGMLALSNRIIFAGTDGMETSLVIFFMAASWWAYVEGRLTLAGILTGLLLWTRIDTFIWPLVLAFSAGKTSLRRTTQMLTICAVVYLPWLIFATLYFGSPIPHTIIAKWVAYIQIDPDPIISQIPIVLNYLAPFALSISFFGIGILAWLTIAIMVWEDLHMAAEKTFRVLPYFTILEITRLVLTRATFFDHYLYPALWVSLLQLGLGLGRLWDSISPNRRSLKAVFALTMVMFTGLNIIVFTYSAVVSRDFQANRQDFSLKGVGLWLNQNTPSNSTVLLEPLGYIGYYADRKIYDEVGLISPGIVEMKRQGINDVYQYVTAYQIDYVVTHCDEGLAWKERSERGEISFAKDFSLAAEFNPLGFDPDINTPQDNTARDDCYEIWQRNH